jgi:hypothetical protein
MAIRPELTSRQAWTLSTSGLSVIGSIVDHRAKLPAIQVRALLADLADAVLAAEVPDVADSVVEAGSPVATAMETSKSEALLNESMTAVIDAYVTRSFDQPELDYAYYTERLNMTPADQNILRNLQRATVELWVEQVVAVRPDWTPGQARFAVHAAMSLVIDLGRLMRYENSAQARAVVEQLVDLTLLGRYRLRAALPAR